MRNKKGLITFVAMLMFFGLVGPVLANQQGNTGGNLNDFGNFVRQGDWIYYSQYIGTSASTLTKYNIKTGRQKVILKDRSIYSLNIVGEWIYYLAEFPDKKFHNSYAIYKIKTDGTGKKKLTNSTTEEARYITVSGPWIYYDNWADGNKLYRIRTDGTKKEKLADIKDVWSIAVQGNWVYFVEGNGKRIYRVTTDGKELTKILMGEFWFQDPVVQGDWIYYRTAQDIKRVRTDGSYRETLIDSGIRYEARMKLHVLGDKLYFTIEQDPKTGNSDMLYVSNLDGTQITPLIHMGKKPFDNLTVFAMFSVGDHFVIHARDKNWKSEFLLLNKQGSPVKFLNPGKNRPKTEIQNPKPNTLGILQHLKGKNNGPKPPDLQIVGKYAYAYGFTIPTQTNLNFAVYPESEFTNIQLSINFSMMESGEGELADLSGIISSKFSEEGSKVVSFIKKVHDEHKSYSSEKKLGMPGVAYPIRVEGHMISITYKPYLGLVNVWVERIDENRTDNKVQG